MSYKTQRAIALTDDSLRRPAFSATLRSELETWRSAYVYRISKPDGWTAEYCRIAANELGKAGIRISPRRVRQLVKNISALLSIRGSRREEKAFEVALNWSLPQRAWGAKISEHVIHSVHRTAWGAANLNGSQDWLSEFHLERRLSDKIEKLVSSCPSADSGTLAVTQLLANEPKDRAAMFAYAVYPAALEGTLNIGSEGISELGKTAAEVLDIRGRFPSSKDPDHQRLQNVLDSMTGKRRERAAQLFNYLLINKLSPEDPVAVEEELDECITSLRSLSR
jgi:hypothetical protein